MHLPRKESDFQTVSLYAEDVELISVHTASACSPTRSMLMSGTDNHIAGVGVMSEQRGWDLERWNKKGHEGYLSQYIDRLIRNIAHDRL